ncbi:hypothetical protein K469DRAFT_707133 [Zopfia rhizophila CBS 207.26]|uniref:Uncharacterized protein n=1 Tax=Zopfia rhizophila CBS 207.26 TaxID=1314779 RepID=A0A6A6E5C3_9PEZI|nr:hypothetical protein K469DRAFT_707133 [Zopfia rhizophila CBS 207.26]
MSESGGSLAAYVLPYWQALRAHLKQLQLIHYLAAALDPLDPSKLNSWPAEHQDAIITAFRNHVGETNSKANNQHVFNLRTQLDDVVANSDTYHTRMSVETMHKLVYCYMNARALRRRPHNKKLLKERETQRRQRAKAEIAEIKRINLLTLQQLVEAARQDDQPGTDWWNLTEQEQQGLESTAFEQAIDDEEAADELVAEQTEQPVDQSVVEAETEAIVPPPAHPTHLLPQLQTHSIFRLSAANF